MAEYQRLEDITSESKRKSLETLLSGRVPWNQYRSIQSGTIDLSGIDIGFEVKRRLGLGEDQLLPLSQFDMHDVNLSGTNLRRFVFDQWIFSYANLNGADLSYTEFPGSVLMNASLSKAYLYKADFRGTDLTGADFTDCDLRATSLTGANLSCSRLCLASTIIDDVQFDRVQMAIRDDFEGSSYDYDLWREQTEKRMHRSLDELTKNQLEVDPIDDDIRRMARYRRWSHLELPTDRGTVQSVRSVLEKVENLKWHYDNAFDPDVVGFYYRGEECNGWSLTSSLHRDSKIGSESELVRELMTRVPDDFLGTESLFDRLVLAQQSGLPTRLLDVTRNPLVALYFALQRSSYKRGGRSHRRARIHAFAAPSAMVRYHDDDDVSLVAAFSQRSSIEQDVILTRCFEWRERPWPASSEPHDFHALPTYLEVVDRCANVLSPTKPYLRGHIDPKAFFGVYVVEPKRAFGRLRAQAGAFIVSAFHRRLEKEKVVEIDASSRIYDHYTIDVDISEESRKIMLKQLDNLGINEETLFPGLESAAKAIAAQHAKPPSETESDCCDQDCDATSK